MSILPSLRFVLGSLDVRMWRTLVWCRLILPVPVLEKRLDAPEWVLSLGIIFSISAAAFFTGAGPYSEPLWEQGLPCRKVDQISISQVEIYRHHLAPRLSASV